MFFSSNRAARLRAYVLLALLPALLLRAAVPVGYMVSFTESGAAAITLCPGVASVPASASHHGPLGPAGVDDHSTHHQHGEHDHAGSHSSGHDHSQPACPFAAALVAAATPPTIAIGLTEPNVSAAERFAVAHEAPARFPLLRIQSPRAPPALI